ncbi:hypothetical protein [Spirosoma linguale]|uniref:Uncharacterized protein n=1 Tax=Spirosoma linguale (strain ATCC 33905 / DSM 74 / LMG 10896 / Claus 1) TaxID=504472 RepID=D2QGN5_SPILD|nr:hypothetical protein Slin_2525 [Spirosoma linguale DSM 74]
MTPTLRRTHQAIWFSLAIVLPLVFVAVLYLTPQPLRQEPIYAPLPSALPILVRSVNSPALTVSLRTSPDARSSQLEIRVKTALETPSAVVRVRQKNTWQPVGLLNAPGLYRFPLTVSDSHPQLDLWDDIHRHRLQTINL